MLNDSSKIINEAFCPSISRIKALIDVCCGLYKPVHFPKLLRWQDIIPDVTDASCRYTKLVFAAVKTTGKPQKVQN